MRKDERARQVGYFSQLSSRSIHFMFTKDYNMYNVLLGGFSSHIGVHLGRCSLDDA